MTLPLGLDAWALCFGLVLARLSGVLLSLPLLSDVMPTPLRVAFGLVISFVLASMLGPVSGTTLGLASLALALGSELAVGLCIGFAVRVLFAAVDGAGQIVGVQLSLSFAGNVDPLLREEAIVTTKLFSAFAWLAFFGVGGLQAIIVALIGSFERIPLGTANLLSATAAAGWVSESIQASVRLALPVLAGMLVLQSVLALASRLVAELNPFAFAFAAMTCVGLFLFVASFEQVLVIGRDVPDRLLFLLGQQWGGQ